MKDYRYWIGVIVSAIWVCVAVAFVVWKGPVEKISEWGDFFAGFAAPLAFLWLVLGYKQQGEQLMLTTNATAADFEATHRPWVSCEASVGPADWPPLQLDDAGVFIQLQLKLKNTGHSPAFNVSPNLRAFVDDGVHRSDLKAAQQAATPGPSEIAFGGGFTLFPGQEITLAVGVHALRAEIEAAKRQFFDTTTSIAAVGVVSYQSATDKTHFTGLCYWVCCSEHEGTRFVGNLLPLGERALPRTNLFLNPEAMRGRLFFAT